MGHCDYISSGKLENKQQISASGNARLELPDHLFVYFFEEKPEIWIFK